jgi:hypothetical protein
MSTQDQPISYERDIKPLFREIDHQRMEWAFDLWSYEDVSAHADAILTRLSNGTMPCDGAWPDASVQTFQRWVDAGRPR